MTRLNGKTALVTGSTDGVGRLVAKRLGEAGARVLVHGRSQQRGMALRDEVVSAITFMLRLRISKQLRRSLGIREETDAKVLAEQIVAHLERSRIRFSQEPAPPPHSTFGSNSGKEDPPEQS